MTLARLGSAGVVDSGQRRREIRSAGTGPGSLVVIPLSGMWTTLPADGHMCQDAGMAIIQTALPDLFDWVTIEAAAELLGVSRRTVHRMIADEKLRAYEPRCGRLELRRPTLLRYAEVMLMRQALQRVRGIG